MACAAVDVLEDGVELRHVVGVDLLDGRILRVHQHGEQRRVHGEVLARRVHVVAGRGQQLAELGVDHLGRVEHGDEAHEVAREHAVEQQVDLLGRQLDAGLGQRGGDLRLGLGDLVLVLGDALLGILDVAVEAVDGVGEHAGQHGVLGRA